MRKKTERPAESMPIMTIIDKIACAIIGHQYRVIRRMNPGARKVCCDRCLKVWGMHDKTKSFVPWTNDLESLYAHGGPLDPEIYKG
jgi:hypothetical protein